MRLVFVHGRAQGGRTEAEMRSEWLGALERGYAKAGVAAPPNVEIRNPFYADRLDALTEDAVKGVGAVIERGATSDGSVDSFDAAFLRALAEGAGITDADINGEMGAGFVEKGPENAEWVHALGRLLSRRVPWLSGKLMAAMTADVNAYLKRPHVRGEINGLVSEHIDGPSVVVGHSLGSIVAYWVLHELRDDAEVPLFVTIGSPLGIDVVKKYLPRPLGRPEGVSHWFNGTDERDPVALFSKLEPPVFPDGIENLNDIQNPHDWPHGISGYLSDERVARTIANALGT